MEPDQPTDSHENSLAGERLFDPRLFWSGTGAESVLDPFGMAAPMAEAALAWWLHPVELAERSQRFAAAFNALQLHSAARLAGAGVADAVPAQPDDTRFSDPAWTENSAYNLLKQWYLFWTHQMQDAIFEAPGLAPKERRRAAFWSRDFLNAMAPTNFLATNPAAIRRAAETHGESLSRGFENFMEDLRAGTVRMTDPTKFQVGQNLATTPGAVVFRNRLFELIHYAPAAGKVRPMPILLVPPCINKFYVLDLDAKKSLAAYLLRQGFDVYMVSWKNPGADMRDTGFDDYVIQGVGEAVRVASAASGSEKIHAVGYCVGGTMLASYMAWCARHYAGDEQPVAHWTLLATLVDFQSPGDVEVFLDEHSVNWIAGMMRARGYLDGAEMATTFRMLRSNSLIWHYMVHGWLLGEPPPAHDVLYWNMDTTRMPCRMHEYYLREMYLKNNLVRPNALTIAGEPIDLALIRQPLYQVATEDDHIAPWRQTFRLSGFVGSPVRFVLSSSGHILGIVNPPVSPPKRSYRVAPATRGEGADAWQAKTEPLRGSWWEDWSAWLGERCGELREPPALAGGEFPKLADAPGTYVLER